MKKAVLNLIGGLLLVFSWAVLGMILWTPEEHPKDDFWILQAMGAFVLGSLTLIITNTDDYISF